MLLFEWRPKAKKEEPIPIIDDGSIRFSWHDDNQPDQDEEV
jgi:hypothetical protein